MKLLLGLFLLINTVTLHAQDSTKQKSLEIYGFIMTDAGYNFKQIDPNWFDVVRTTKLPAYKDQFGADGKCSENILATISSEAMSNKPEVRNSAVRISVASSCPRLLTAFVPASTLASPEA